jgi:hypothetical protein
MKCSAKSTLLDAKVVLEFINGKDISDTLINFYAAYISKISELVVTDTENCIEVKYVDKDLIQQLNLCLIECQTNLRKNIRKHLNPNDDFKIQIE